MKKLIYFFILLFFSTGVVSAQSKKWGVSVDCGILATDLGSSAFNAGMLSVSPFYAISDVLSVGAGAGYMILFDNAMDINIKNVPLYLYGRGDFLKNRRFSPFVSGRLGYGIISDQKQFGFLSPDANGELHEVQTDRSYSGGLFASLSVGALYHLPKKKAALSLGLTTHLQKIKVKDNTGIDPFFKSNINNVVLSVDFGVVF